MFGLKGLSAQRGSMFMYFEDYDKGQYKVLWEKRNQFLVSLGKASPKKVAFELSLEG